MIKNVLYTRKVIFLYSFLIKTLLVGVFPKYNGKYTDIIKYGIVKHNEVCFVNKTRLNSEYGKESNSHAYCKGGRTEPAPKSICIKCNKPGTLNFLNICDDCVTSRDDLQ